MRYGPLVAVLAISATAVSGCQTTTPDFDSGVSAATGSGGSGTGGSGTGGTGTGGTGTGGTGTGSPTGTSTGQSLGSGSTSLVFNDGGESATGNALTQVTISNAGAGIGTESASVAVDTGSTSMTWAAPIDMELFSNTQSPLPGLTTMGGNYSEYRRIDTDTDAELQIWEYDHSRVGQYAVWFDPSAPNANNFVNFFDGNATPDTSLPTATATYNGRFGGIAEASNWISRDRVIDDPYDTEELAGDTWDPNGTWRVTGSSQVTANFGAGTVTGSITNTTWRKFVGSPSSPDGYITILPGETSRPFHDYTMSGTISGNTYTGSVTGPTGAVVNGDNTLQGGFFGPNAEETAGAIRSFTTSPGPDDGISPYDENRRGFIDLRGVYQGDR